MCNLLSNKKIEELNFLADHAIKFFEKNNGVTLKNYSFGSWLSGSYFSNNDKMIFYWIMNRYQKNDSVLNESFPVWLSDHLKEIEQPKKEVIDFDDYDLAIIDEDLIDDDDDDYILDHEHLINRENLDDRYSLWYDEY